MFHNEGPQILGATVHELGYGYIVARTDATQQSGQTCVCRFWLQCSRGLSPSVGLAPGACAPLSQIANYIRRTAVMFMFFGTKFLNIKNSINANEFGSHQR
jgi:hypothetical protein